MNKPLLIAIAALSRNNVIGKNGKLPWHIPEDLQFFKQQTLHKPMIMGRKTRDSFGKKPLPQRPHIVITHDTHYQAEGSIICHTIQDALKTAQAYDNDTYVIGGGNIYGQMIDLVDRIILSEVNCDAEGDIFFPKFDTHSFSKTILHDYSDLATPLKIIQYDRLR